MADEDVDSRAENTQARSLRVIVRVRPVLPVDGPGAPSSLLATSGQGALALKNPQDQRATRQYNFDAVLDVQSTQADLYHATRMDSLVSSVVSGYHATVFAYGQTGSGKTHTMEGYKYLTPVLRHGSTKQPGGGGSKGPRAVPHPDFESTAAEDLGLVPRAVAALFEATQRRKDTRTMIKVSFVQLYREQVYDLLNPSGAAVISAQAQQPPTPGGSNGGRNAVVIGRPLHMRWSKTQEFYLENLFKVECSSCAEVMAAFRQGVRSKVMASHAMNASSSRSHAMLTLYLDTHPLASPSEVVSSKLTLVDLAGSERSERIGAGTQGLLHEESVAINKSLFTLRQVIVALTNHAKPQPLVSDNTSTTSTPAASNGSHVPYRDSKLTALLKQSLGGNSLTTMVACVAAADSAYEENISTLDYAAMARRVVNQVVRNEDPRNRIIHELRQEVTFLRKQLAALQAPGSTTLLTGISGGNGSGTSPVAAAALPTSALTQPLAITCEAKADQLPLSEATHASSTSQALSPQQNSISSGGPTATMAVPAVPIVLAPPAAGLVSGASCSSAHDGSGAKEALLRAAEQDMQVIVDRLVSSATLVQHLATTNQELRSAYNGSQSKVDNLKIDNDSLMAENATLRDRLSMLEGAVGIDDGGGPGTKGGQGGAGVLHTAGTATLLELQELRQENALLHIRLQAFEFAPHSQGGGTGAQVLVLDEGRGGGRKGKGLVRNSSQVSRHQLASVNRPSHSAQAPQDTSKGAAGVLSNSPGIMSVSELRSMLGSAGRGDGGGKAQNLTSRTHQLASQSVLVGSRVTTTGQMLQGSVLAQQQSPIGPRLVNLASVPGAGLGVEGVADADSGSPVLAASAGGDEVATRLAQLIAQRNILARERVSRGMP